MKINQPFKNIFNFPKMPATRIKKHIVKIFGVKKNRLKKDRIRKKDNKKNRRKASGCRLKETFCKNGNRGLLLILESSVVA